MLLENDQVLQLLKSPANAGALDACIRHERRLQFHVEPWVDPLNPPEGLRDFLAWVEKLLPKDKFKRFKELVVGPLPTTDICETIFAGLGRVFEAQDSLVQCTLRTEELEADFQRFQDQQKENEFWNTEAYEAMQTALHSFLVVDMAQQQRTRYPEPYTLLVESNSVFDTQVRKDGQCEYLFVRLPDKDENTQQFACYDDGFYRVIEQPKGDPNLAIITLANPHALGYTPARMLWSQRLRKGETVQRRGPITAQLGALDMYLFWHFSIEYYKTHGMWPILWKFEEDCGFTGPKGEPCKDGFVWLECGYTKTPDGFEEVRHERTECPACALRKFIGPGTILEVPMPSKESGDTRNPVGLVPIDVDALEFAEKQQSNRREALITSCLGAGGEPANDQAQNEKQVQSSFESRQDVLMRLKLNFERAHQWDLQTKGVLRYGSLFQQAYVSYGERFYLKTPEQLIAEMVESKKAGQPLFEQAMAREFFYDTKYRNNPRLRDRMRILADLEPYSEYSLGEIMTLLSTASTQGNTVVLDLFDADLLRLKARFPYYIALFESRHADIRSFAALQPYDVKLRLITELLLSYLPAKAPPTTALPPGPAPQLQLAS